MTYQLAAVIWNRADLEKCLLDTLADVFNHGIHIFCTDMLQYIRTESVFRMMRDGLGQVGSLKAKVIADTVSYLLIKAVIREVKHLDLISSLV